MAITISVLDQSPIYPGETPEEAFQHTIKLAQLSEELGFHRFWVSEHHDSEQVAGSSRKYLSHIFWLKQSESALAPVASCSSITAHIR